MIGLINLFHCARPSNDNLSVLKDAERHTLAFTIAITGPLASASGLTRANSWTLLVRFIEIILRIHTLINGLLIDTEDAVFIHESLEECVAFDEGIYEVIGVDQLHGDFLDLRGLCAQEGRLRKPINFCEKPSKSLLGKFHGRHASHLEGTIGKEFHIGLLPLTWLVLTAKNNSGLIMESVFTNIAISETVAFRCS